MCIRDSSEPYYSSQACEESSSSLNNWPNKPSTLSGYSAGDPIYYYIEDDFGKELKECLNDDTANTSPIRGLSDTQANDQIINVIISAAETWNIESRSSVLVYAGTLNIEDLNTGCSSLSTTKKPAIFIKIRKGCKPNPVNNACDGTPTASSTREFIGSCNNTAEIALWADTNSFSGCNNSGVFDWKIDGEQGTQNLKTTFVHEFGHILGLGHPESYLGSQVGDQSVMESTTTSDEFEWNAHLFQWDKDCSDDTSTGHRNKRRIIEYRYQSFDSSGNEYSTVQSNESDITKGFISGNYMRDDMDIYGGLFLDDKISTDLIGTSGSVSLTNRSTFSSSLDLLDPILYYQPVLMTPLEKSGTNQDHRITYNRSLIGTAPYIADPPSIDYIRSNNFFASQNSGPYRYEICANEPTCTTTFGIKSHIPFVSAWDNVSENTVFVGVDTDRDNFNGHGEIDVYPGFRDTNNNQLLRSPSRLSVNRTPPTDNYTDFNYTLKTDVSPAVACAPNRNVFDFNCILAWVDRGITDGRILYTYFRIDNNEIIWSNTHGVFVRSYTKTFNNISASFFDGSFWLAWKTIGNDISYCRTDTGETDWDDVVTKTRSKVVDPPTWIYVPETNKESILVWTEFDSN